MTTESLELGGNVCDDCLVGMIIVCWNAKHVPINWRVASIKQLRNGKDDPQDYEKVRATNFPSIVRTS